MAAPAHAPAPGSFEELIKRLEVLVQRLESSDLSLEEALEAYQQGVELARAGHERLGAAERRIEELTRGGTTRPIEAGAVLRGEGPPARPGPTEQ